MYHYRECGLRNVWLVNGYDEHDTPYGLGVAIHDLEGVHHAVAHGLVSKGGKLTGAELRFLRQEMGISQAKPSWPPCWATKLRRSPFGRSGAASPRSLIDLFGRSIGN